MADAGIGSSQRRARRVARVGAGRPGDRVVLRLARLDAALRTSGRAKGLPDAAVARAFSRRLRAWYARRGRDLPWRASRDPYRILVSELMLQQTQVSRVLGFYDRFLARFPTLDAVARARPGEVREAWRGLGYYARARNLHRLAREVSPPNGNGTMPDEPEALGRLPGIGAYTAGAVASFAYERRAPLVDTNVARVLRRVFAPRVDPRTARGHRRLWQIAAAILPRTGKGTWTHNQALMELGALVCTARVMRCEECPVVRYCATGNRKQETGNRK